MPSTTEHATSTCLASTTACEPTAASRPRHRARHEPQTLTAAGLTVILVGVLLPMIDFFIVNVALPTIDRDLHASQPLLELVVSGYATAYALLLVLGGRLGDSIGRKRLFLIGMAAFTLTSLACGLAPTATSWSSAGSRRARRPPMMVPQVLATIQAATTGERRARALGRYGATGGLAAVLGQVLGGLLVSANIDGLGWRPIFLVNVPIGLVGPGAGQAVRARHPARRARADRRARHGPARPDRAGLLIPLTEGRSLRLAGLDHRAAGRRAAGGRRVRAGRASGRAGGPHAAGAAVPAAAPEHAPRPDAGAAVLRRLRRVHVLLRAAGAGRAARQCADGGPRARADGGHVPARIAVDLPAARALRRQGAGRWRPAAGRRAGHPRRHGVPGLAAPVRGRAGAGPGGRRASARAW